MNNWLLIIIVAVLGLIYSFLLSQADLVSGTVLSVLWVLVLTGVSIILVRLLVYLFVDVLFVKITHKRPSNLLRLIISLVLYGIAATIILKFALNQDIAALLTSLGVLTVVLGFAMQSTLSNLFGGVSLELEQPFKIGDWVKIQGVMGQVESFTWRAISIRTYFETLYVVPNSVLSSDSIEVLPSDRLLWAGITFPAPLTVPPEKVINLAIETIQTIPKVAPHIKPLVQVKDYKVEHASIIYEAWYMVEECLDIWITNGLVRKRLWYAFARHGIDLPSPAMLHSTEPPCSLPSTRFSRLIHRW